MSKDPICGMEVEGERFAFEIGGRKYFFCSKGCLDKSKESSDEGTGKPDLYDLVIIGAGLAGLNAAIYASVMKISTLLITKDIGEKELIAKLERKFLHEHYLEHRIDEVIKIKRKGGIFEVFTKKGSGITAFALIIATGINAEFYKDLAVLSKERGLMINADCSTNVEGVFVCSDVADSLEKRVIVASRRGEKACLVVKNYLLEIGVK